jgi:hypothetical protein
MYYGELDTNFENPNIYKKYSGSKNPMKITNEELMYMKPYAPLNQVITIREDHRTSLGNVLISCPVENCINKKLFVYPGALRTHLQIKHNCENDIVKESIKVAQSNFFKNESKTIKIEKETKKYPKKEIKSKNEKLHKLEGSTVPKKSKKIKFTCRICCKQARKDCDKLLCKNCCNKYGVPCTYHYDKELTNLSLTKYKSSIKYSNIIILDLEASVGAPENCITQIAFKQIYPNETNYASVCKCDDTNFYKPFITNAYVNGYSEVKYEDVIGSIKTEKQCILDVLNLVQNNGEKVLIAAHNRNVEENNLKKRAKSYGLNDSLFHNILFVDTISLFLYVEHSARSLASLYKKYFPNNPKPKFHDAMIDVECTYKVLMEKFKNVDVLMNELKIRGDALYLRNNKQYKNEKKLNNLSNNSQLNNSQLNNSQLNNSQNNDSQLNNSQINNTLDNTDIVDLNISDHLFGSSFKKLNNENVDEKENGKFY